MKMPQNSRASLKRALHAAEDLSAHAEAKVRWSDLVTTTNQLPANATLMELVETAINGHPTVQISLARTKKNPFTGALLVADVVLKISSGPANDMDELHHDILRHRREALPLHNVPATINFVPTLVVAETGKLLRQHA